MVGTWLGAGAEFSPDRVYRYKLWRIWDLHKHLVAFCMLNPSTADEETEDPTIRRCISFARRWGGGGVVILNAFAFRATDPADLMKAADPVGPANDRYLAAACGWSRTIVAAWGVHGEHRGRAAVVRALLGADLYHLGLTKDGHPKHPLYLPGATKPELWT